MAVQNALNKSKDYLENVAAPVGMEIVTKSGTVTMTTAKDALLGTGKAVVDTAGTTMSQINRYTPDIYDVGNYGQKDFTADAGMFLAGHSAMVAQNAYRMTKIPTKYALKVANFALYKDHKPISVFGHQITQGYRMSRAKSASENIMSSNKMAQLHYSEILVGKSRADVWSVSDRLPLNRYQNNLAFRADYKEKMSAMRIRYKGMKYDRMVTRSKRLKNMEIRMKQTQFSPVKSTKGMVRNQSRKIMNQIVSGNDGGAYSTRVMHVMQKSVRIGGSMTLKSARQAWVKRKQIANFLKNTLYTVRHPVLSVKNLVNTVVGTVRRLISAIVGIVTNISVVVSMLAVLLPFIVVVVTIVTVIMSIFSYSALLSTSIDPNVVANQEYALNAFIYEAKQRNWKAEAIIGTMAYIMQEGSGMGTFTYESYWLHTGPSGVTNDTTMNNQAWLDWLNTDGLAQAHVTYSSSGNSNYAAVGIGLLADSDVWSSPSNKTVTKATALIQYADALGKCWQDPKTQLTYYFDEMIAHNPTFFDTVGCDPTRDNRSADEWCRRVTAGYGMPAWSWMTNNQVMLAHTAHVPQAREIYNNYTSFQYSYLISAHGGSVEGDPDFSNTEAWRTANPYAQAGLLGQCTWFAWGRFYEIYGYSPGFTGDGSQCAAQLVRAHPDRFRISSTPAVGAVFSTSGRGTNTNHVGIVVGVSANTITIQDGNYNGLTDSWGVAITDWKTMTYDLSNFNVIYAPIYAVPY